MSLNVCSRRAFIGENLLHRDTSAVYPASLPVEMLLCLRSVTLLCGASLCCADCDQESIMIG